jgi:hypothetical protein
METSISTIVAGQPYCWDSKAEFMRSTPDVITATDGDPAAWRTAVDHPRNRAEH